MREQLRERFLNEESNRTQLKKEIQNCIGKNTEECQGIRENATHVVKGVLGKVCQNNNQIMENVRTKIQNNPKLTDEEKETMIQFANEQETQFQGLCDGTEDMNATQLKERAKEMKRLMQESKVKFELAKDLVHARRVGLIIERAEHLETRLNNLNVSECNSTELPGLIEQFSGNVTEAREAYDEAKDLWQQFKESIKNNETNKELLREAQAKYKEAQLNLKEAHVVLKDIIGELRDCKKAPEEIAEEPEQ